MIQPTPKLIAQNIVNPTFSNLTDMSPTEFLGGLFPALISLGLVIGAIVFLFYFVMGAIHWITSGGDKMKLELSRKKITTALVGLIILLSFVAILALAENLFGIGLRRIEVGPFRIELTGGSTNSSVGCDYYNIPDCGGSACPVCNESSGTWYCDSSMTPPCPI